MRSDQSEEDIVEIYLRNHEKKGFLIAVHKLADAQTIRHLASSKYLIPLNDLSLKYKSKTIMEGNNWDEL